MAAAATGRGAPRGKRRGLIDYLQQFPAGAQVVLRGSEVAEGALALDVALEQFASGDYEA